MDEYYRKASEAAEFIKANLSVKPEIGIVLGSGLGPIVDEIEEAVSIDYTQIPGFPATTVAGHAGKLVCGRLNGRIVLAMKGRFHYYEGHETAQVVFYVRVFKLLGIENMLVTNAAGGINKSFKPGDLMLIRDHIGFFAPSPLRGKNLDELGPRFPDMSQAYDRKLLEIARSAAKSVDVAVQEGVYAFAQGPMYETPAEIRAFGILGADAVGMSTVPEVIAARHSGIRVLGISCITNMAAGILDQPLSHEEVMKTASEVETKFIKLVKAIIGNWNI